MNIENDLKDFPVVTLESGELLLHEGERKNSIYFLKDGAVKVTQKGYDVAIIDEKGAVFGEMSLLLDHVHTASVECLRDSIFYRIDSPKSLCDKHPEINWHISRILAVRLFNLTQYLVDVKRQFEGHGHLDMVEEVLSTLLNQNESSILKRADSQRDTPDY